MSACPPDVNRAESDSHYSRVHGVLDDVLPGDAVGHAHRRHGRQPRRLLRHEEVEAERGQSCKGKRRWVREEEEGLSGWLSIPSGGVDGNLGRTMERSTKNCLFYTGPGLVFGLFNPFAMAISYGCNIRDHP